METELICGRNAVIELLKTDRTVDTVYISSEEGEKLAYIASMARAKKIVVKNVPSSKLSKMCGKERHQGVAAWAAATEYVDIDDILDIARKKHEDPFVIITDGIEDPHNLGAIIRTAECAGAHGLVFPKRGGSSITSAVQRASAGAATRLPLARVPNIAAAVRHLKDEGVFVYCADMDGQYCAEVDMTGACALVVGSEGNGVSKLVKQLCDVTISLPLKGEIQSLNASVAAGAIIYEIVRQRIVSSKGKKR